MESCLFPRPLCKGDTVAIVSPASVIDPALVEGAVAAIGSRGYRALVAEHALGVSGSYSGSAADRLADLRGVLADPCVRAVLCSRGGYGCVHLLEGLSDAVDPADPRWIVGFSDVSALHALWRSKGIVSVHGSMAKHLALFPDGDADNAALWDILEGGRPQYCWTSGAGSRQGEASGLLVGGNLAVIAGLVSTPYDLFSPGTILFIEDIAEPIYKVERILWQLRLSGVLPALAGLVVGQFTEYRPDRNYRDMEAMIYDMTADYGYPVSFGAPVGHVDHNVPLLHGAVATLSVGDGMSRLAF